MPTRRQVGQTAAAAFLLSMGVGGNRAVGKHLKETADPPGIPDWYIAQAEHLYDKYPGLRINVTHGISLMMLSNLTQHALGVQTAGYSETEYMRAAVYWHLLAARCEIDTGKFDDAETSLAMAESLATETDAMTRVWPYAGYLRAKVKFVQDDMHAARDIGRRYLLDPNFQQYDALSALMARAELSLNPDPAGYKAARDWCARLHIPQDNEPVSPWGGLTRDECRIVAVDIHAHEPGAVSLGGQLALDAKRRRKHSEKMDLQAGTAVALGYRGEWTVAASLMETALQECVDRYGRPTESFFQRARLLLMEAPQTNGGVLRLQDVMGELYNR